MSIRKSSSKFEDGSAGGRSLVTDPKNGKAKPHGDCLNWDVSKDLRSSARVASGIGGELPLGACFTSARFSVSIKSAASVTLSSPFLDLSSIGSFIESLAVM